MNMPHQVLTVRRQKRNQPREVCCFLKARAPRPGAPAEITVTVQLASYASTRLVTAASPAEFIAALVPDLFYLGQDVWAGV
jgi:hypothetical protein